MGRSAAGGAQKPRAGNDGTATRRSGGTDDIAEVHSIADLPQLLPRSHALIITAPLTPETKGLIGREGAVAARRIARQRGARPDVDEPRCIKR
jgi:hypothetical protein